MRILHLSKQPRRTLFRGSAARLQLCSRATVDVDHLRGDEARLVGSEKQHRIGNILRIARTFEQLPHLEVARKDMLPGGGGDTLSENLAGADAVGADIMASAQARDIASKAFEASLCGNIRRRRKSRIPFQNGVTYTLSLIHISEP